MFIGYHDCKEDAKGVMAADYRDDLSLSAATKVGGRSLPG
jgi:hypothetical protein